MTLSVYNPHNDSNKTNMTDVNEHFHNKNRDISESNASVVADSYQHKLLFGGHLRFLMYNIEGLSNV